MFSATLFSIKRLNFSNIRSFAKVSINQIKELRTITGSSIDECKKALEAEEGDLEKAKDYLKKRGLALAQKRSSRSASDGVIGIRFSQDKETAVIAEVNCETDFVAKSDVFLRYVDTLLTSLVNQPSLPTLNYLKYDPAVEEEINTFLSKPLDNKISVEGHECTNLFEAKQLAISKLQENIKIRKLYSVKRSDQSKAGAIGHYVHMTLANGIGKGCCLVDLECGAQNGDLASRVADSLAMQVYGTRPEFVRREDVSQEVLAANIERVKTTLGDSIKNKPQAVADKIIDGKLKKLLEESVLMYQESILENDSKKTVEQYLQEQAKNLGGSVNVKSFKILEVDNDN